MKASTITAFLVFGIGLAMKPFHLPYNAIAMLFGIFLLLVSNVLDLRDKQAKASSKLIGFSNTAYLIALFASLKFLPFAFVALLAASALSVVAYAWAAKQAMLKKTIPLIACASLAWAVFLVPTDKRYYALNLRWSVEADQDAISWDKYSWFLYQNGHLDDALEASGKAMHIAGQQADEPLSAKLKEHQTKIMSRTWTAFH